MFSVPEPLSTASKASIDAQLNLLRATGNQSLEQSARLLDLQLNTFRHSMDEQARRTREVLHAADPQAFWQAISQQADADIWLNYSKQLTAIASASQSELTKITNQQAQDTLEKSLALFEVLSKNLPQGSEPWIALMRSGSNQASAQLENIQKLTRNLAENFEANLNQAGAQVEKAVKAASNLKKS
ncbi:TIGR01841 family phasin [Undibacterium squillarum]|uniref:Phasin domain-containing protein n=1 Tax=Undibacterium squillarum TaxID=1131567 RepID=A0ABQ2Y0Y3_9BURK|nr:TIGR01841 family phasin [Undibacterium squillarum]GGX44074.1 hypothetical protein GCM10010946_23270 [Undibacterium squillarum]